MTIVPRLLSLTVPRLSTLETASLKVQIELPVSSRLPMYSTSAWASDGLSASTAVHHSSLHIDIQRHSEPPPSACRDDWNPTEWKFADVFPVERYLFWLPLFHSWMHASNFSTAIALFWPCLFDLPVFDFVFTVFLHHLPPHSREL